jgi:formate-dependent nitrite reductase membrane component NrfD
MHPTATERTPDTFMWADVVPLHGSNGHSSNGHQNAVYAPETKARNTRWAAGETDIRVPQTQGQPSSGPILFGARVAEQMVQVSYNAQHKIPWHWPVPAYLVTKGIAAGIFMLMTLGWGLGLFSYDGRTALIAGFLTLAFTALTTGLLVYDLERPARFLYIVFRPQWKSWLARGAVLLIGFSIITLIYWLFEIGANLYSYDSIAREILLWLGLPFAVGVAVYTAYLFAQGEGRDLWQSPLLPFHLIVQAFLGGSAALLIVNLFAPLPADMAAGVAIAFAISLLVNLFLILAGEFGVAHPSEVAATAAHEISHGRYSAKFWWGGIGLGNVLPLALLVLGSFIIAPSMGASILLATAALAALAGLYLYEYVFVMAPQDIQNS